MKLNWRLNASSPKASGSAATTPTTKAPPPASQECTLSCSHHPRITFEHFLKNMGGWSYSVDIGPSGSVHIIFFRLKCGCMWATSLSDACWGSANWHASLNHSLQHLFSRKLSQTESRMTSSLKPTRRELAALLWANTDVCAVAAFVLRGTLSHRQCMECFF